MIKQLPLILSLLMMLAGCLPEQQVRAPLGTQGQTTTTDTDDSTTSDTVNPNDANYKTIQWYHQGLYTNSLTLDAANKQNGFLRGDDINNYLQQEVNFDDNYCLVVDFQESATYDIKQLRVKVVPNQFTNYATGTNSRYFRANFIESSGNDICNVDEAKIDPTSGSYTYVTKPSDLVLKTEDVCPSCINFINSTSVKLYKIIPGETGVGTYLWEVDDEDIDTDSLIFRVDMNNYASSQTGSCTNDGCRSLGFDCCVGGQCVNEKAQKPSGVAADPTGFQLAELEKYSDNFWYLKYPQFYYSCLETPPSDEDDLDPPNDPDDPDAEATERLNELIADYQCINELEENSEAVPFHLDPLKTGYTYTYCSVSSSADNYYETVMTRMYNNCGCVETVFSDMVANCPNYTYKPIYKKDNDNNDTDEIESIVCVSPEPATDPVPFQDLEVSVNSRNAPHRFFNKDGVEIDPTKELPDGVDPEQEGDPFIYLDNENLFPVNGSFNMNSILGQMTTTLNQARPAKVITVEFDKMYLIAAQSGYYTPCLNCAKDSWFTNFAAHPSTTQGIGLQSVGHTTQRDAWGSNITLGNYEDTIFGRACWVPPTMLPYSHYEMDDVQEQRLQRLKTQAAMFVNGYQRDWFGFNKGALIGSFDGVTWFAIGKGRIIKSSSTKLFLAVNAPFADLAQANEHIVSVQEYDFISTGAEFDYDPNYSLTSTYQNEGGTCQAHHVCESDSDCITELGWEYVCADVSTLKTRWPKFDPTTVEELVNESKEGSIVSMLAQGELPPGETKRCIYRGAGSPCRKDYSNIGDENLRKLEACAPNFYCADLNSDNIFNKEVARFGAPLESLIEANNHYFGQDANILGRPKEYVGSSGLSTLEDEIITSLSDNFEFQDSNASGQIGLCRPGKLLPSYASATATTNWEPSYQHEAADSDNRTDYISQIAGCNSNLFTDKRYSSCPMLDSSGNYIHLLDEFVDENYTSNIVSITGLTAELATWEVVEIFTTAQNSCGMESLQNGTSYGYNEDVDDVKEYSPFKRVQADPLGSGQLIIEPTFARDACFRKAGAVCHTNFDCSPNRIIAEQVDLFPADYYGNEAEKKYFEEYLICGQAEKEPYPTDDNYDEYSVRNNRCCREVGNDITMYSEDMPDEPATAGLRTDLFGGFNPSNPNRYSRYSALETYINSDGSADSDSFTRVSASITNLDSDGYPRITAPKQWKTIHRTAKKTCCGGGWIRKFADGTNNWKINRLNIEPENFRCLNFLSPLADTETPEEYGTTDSLLSFDRRRTMCVDTTYQVGSCAIFPIDGEDDPGIIEKPTIVTTGSNEVQYIATTEEDMAGKWAGNYWSYSIPQSNDSNDINYLNWALAHDDDLVRRNVIIYVPSWIAYKNDFADEVIVKMEYDGNIATCEEASYDYEADPLNGPLLGPEDFYGSEGSGTASNYCSAAADGCCFEFYEDTRVLKASFMGDGAYPRSSGGANDPGNTAVYGDGTGENYALIMEFTAPGTQLWEDTWATGINDPNGFPHRRASKPGNMQYYLDRLDRFELVGIPQMTYLPVYCNSNYQKLVPGLFDDDIISVNDFIASTSTFENNRPVLEATGTTYSIHAWNSDSASGSNQVTTSNVRTTHVASDEIVDVDPIFSGHEFKCCMKLGGEVDDPTDCCSGYGVQADSGSTSGSGGSSSSSDGYTCMLPPGTDLNVYFNRFVSGEGLDDEDSESITETLEEDDFNDVTGYPKQTKDVLLKLSGLGQQYCENGTVRGGAFGAFPAELNGAGPSDNSEIFSILDSNYDTAQTAAGGPRGYLPYSQGYRWNHHVYCASGNN
jgi:hypothetical protein